MMFGKICAVVEAGDTAALALLLRRAELGEDDGAGSSESLWSAVDSEGRSILQLAVETRNPEVLKCVVEELSGDCLVNLCTKKTGATHCFPECTPLHTAIALEETKILKLLLNKVSSACGQDGKPPFAAAAMWSTADSNGNTILAAALASGNVEIASLVVGAVKAIGRRVNHDSLHQTSLVYIIAAYDDIRHRADNALGKAVSTGKPAIVRSLTDVLTSEELASLLTRCNLVGDTPFDRAAREGHEEIIGILIRKLGALYNTWVHTPFKKVVESSMENKNRKNNEQVSERFSMRFLSNAISSGNTRAVKRILAPLSTEGRHKLMSCTGWGYALSPLQLAFSLGAAECVEVMLDSLVTGPGGSKDLVLSILEQRSGGLTPLHCAADPESVRVLKKYKLSKQALLGLITTGALDCSLTAPVFVPDGMNPLQAMLAGPSGDGRPIRRAVYVMTAMLDLVGDDPNLVQHALSSMDAAGRSTMYTCASLVGSRGLSATDFMALVHYLEDKVNLRHLFSQKNIFEGISVSDLVQSMEQDLYSWGFTVNDCVSRAVNRQERTAKEKITSLRTKAMFVNLAAFCFLCISIIAIVAGVFYVLCSKQTNDTRSATITVAVVLFTAAFYLVLFALAFLLLSSALKESSEKSLEKIGVPGEIFKPSFNNGVLLDQSHEIHFRPEGIGKSETARTDVRGARDPLSVYSSSPSASSLLVYSGTMDVQRRGSGDESKLPVAKGVLSVEDSCPSNTPGEGVQDLTVESIHDEQAKGLGE
ncbi:ankyrin repeat domain-containing protein [Neorickettsia findlayensis]|uniref:Ankyrin repeat domain-containing protein n=1 Tax=Neorickettsia findlayensis TaxID=2686014 RepID=A0A6P1G9K7_9RICK|nr:ankyrin repeat domain-containing protein [Neorickettsia findlayensis]QHD64884.1 ankyrin repeat domain-containing protein [Neorickettsia findlayensis]